MKFEDYGLIYCSLDRKDVELFSIADVESFFQSLLENPAAAYNKLNIVVTGYDEDNRELWEIEQVRNYLKFIDMSFPYFFFFLNRDIPTNASPFTLLLASCLPITKSILKDGTKRLEFDLKNFPEFLSNHFEYMNELSDKCGFSEEENIKASDEIMKIYEFK